MASCRRLPRIWSRQKASGCSCWRGDRYVSQQSDVERVKEYVPKGQVTIPMKKKRDSLSILKALSSTVEQVKGPSYQTIDDPYMLTNRNDMFLCYLSRASGQKTARYFVNKYRSAFDHEDMAPFVQAFQPDQLEYKFTTLSNDAIHERVQRRQVTKAVEVYEKMKQQGMEVSEAAKLELLELMCAFDSKDPPEKRLPLEMIFSVQQNKETPETSTMALDVYNDLKEKTEEAQNWMLQGFLMGLQAEQAIAHYKEMKANNVPVYQNSYHEMLRKTTQLAYLTNSKTYDTVLGLLREMANAGMQPTLVTFHCVMRGVYRNAFLFLDFLPKVFAEMKELDIEPNFETWSLVMQVLQNCLPVRKRDNTYTRTPTEFNLAQMSQYIKDSIEYMSAHPQEVYFSPRGNYFQNAMKICHYKDDSELALLVNDFKDSLGNKYIVTNLNKEEEYYFCLFDLLSRTEPCQKVLDIYNKTFGHLWLENETFLKVLASIDMFKEYQYLPMLFEDYMSRSPRYPDNAVLDSMFYMMSLDDHPEELKATFKGAAMHVFSLMKQFFDPQRRGPPDATADWDVHTHLIKIFANNDDLETAWDCFMTCYKNQDKLNKFTWSPSLHPLIDAIIDAKDQSKMETFVSIADVSMNHSLDIDAYRPKLETFMAKEDIDTMQKGQKKRIQEKYGL